MFRKALWSVALVVAVLAVGVPAFVLVNRGDPPVEDADLRIERLEIAPGENGIILLRGLEDGLWLPDSLGDRLLRMVWGEVWEAELATELLERNRGALAGVPAVLAAPEFQAMEPRGETLSGLVHVLSLARLVSLRAIANARDGREDEALRDLTMALELGQRTRATRAGGLLHALIGVAATHAALAAGAASFAYLSPTPADSLLWNRRWEQLRTPREVWTRVWMREYEEMARTIDQVRMEDTQAAYEIPSELVGYSYLFKPNATKALYAERARALQAGTGGLCSELVIPDFASPEGTLARLRMFLGPNSIGRILFHVGSIDSTRYEQKRCAADTRLGATQVLFALRAWQAAHGELPAKLDVLVPQYLDAIPRDSFAGDSMDYDAAKRTIGARTADTKVDTRWPIQF